MSPGSCRCRAFLWRTRWRISSISIAELVDPEAGAPAEDRLISGDPKFLTWNLEEEKGGLYAGVWEATPGKWRIEYDEWEFCHILSGVSVISEDGGEARTVKAGDSFVLRPGFKGTLGSA